MCCCMVVIEWCDYCVDCCECCVGCMIGVDLLVCGDEL